MLVEGQCLTQPTLLDHDERNAIGEGVSLIGMAAEIGPASVEEILVDKDKRFGIGHQAVTTAKARR